MKKIIFILITSIVISFSALAQSSGDYRSIGNGNWNDATKWEIYNGSNWINATTYPGQNPGTGAVNIMNETEITITASVPHPVASLYVNADFDQVLPFGVLTFSSPNPISLTVSGDVIIYGGMGVIDQNGAKSHSLTIGSSFVAGAWIYIQDSTCIDYYPCPGYYYSIGGDIQTISNDDKLGVTFNTTKPNSSISGSGTITFQDISFDGIGISVETSIHINGTARFMNGLVKSGNFCGTGCVYDASGNYWCPPCGAMFFNDGATVSGASVASFVDGRVWKQGDDPFTFPIGNDGIYSPLTISAPVNAEDVFSAHYVRSGGDPTLWGISDSGLYSVSNCEYWELNAGYENYNYNFTSYVDVSVGWNASSSCGSSSYITNVPDVNLAHFNGASWNSHGGSGTGTTTNGSVTWSRVNNFGSFTLGNLNKSCVTPFGLNTTNITSNSATLSWSAVNGSVSYDLDYKPTTTNWWTNAATAITSTSYNLSGLNPLVTYDWKVRANCSSSSSAYRLGPQFTTQNPCGIPSGLSTTNITPSSATLSWAAVTNAINYTVEYKQSSSASWTLGGSGINSLSYSLSGLSPATAYDWRVSVLCFYNPYTSYGSSAAQASFTTLACDDIYEPNNGSSQAKTISVGTTISAIISSAVDADWFKVTTSNNASTSLQVTLFNSPADYDLYVYNKNLTLVGSSTATGISDETVTYNSPLRKAIYYIKIVGKNGTYNASLCYNLLVRINGTGQAVSRVFNPGNEITEGSANQLLYPNPASEFVSLRFNSTVQGTANAQILNSTGQLVKLYSVTITKGYNQVQIPVTDIRPGMYLLRINKDALNMIRKFVIAR